MSDVVMASRPTGSKQAFATSRRSSVRVVADWLCLAATPTFAFMALLTAVGGDKPDALCAAVHDALSLGGMVPMYLLMSAFHSASWPRLICGREGDKGPSETTLPSASNMV